MLIEMRAQDFCCFEDIKLPLLGEGLVWIGGFNHDSEAAISNGSGKSTLFKALTWCLYGDTIDGERGDKVIRHGARMAVVEADLEGGWTVRRERRHGAPKLLLTKSDEPWKGDRKTIQAKIIDLVGLDFQAFKNTILYGQNDSARFADPRVTDAARKEMLHRITRSEVLKVCHKEALERRSTLKKELDQADSRLYKLRSDRDSAKSRARVLKERMEAWGAHQADRATAVLDEARSYRDRAREMLQDSPDVGELREEQARLQEGIDAAERAAEAEVKANVKVDAAWDSLSTMREDRVRMVADITHLERHVEQLSGDECPLCGDSLVDGGGKAMVEEVTGRLDSAKAALCDFDARMERSQVIVEKRKRARDSVRAKAALAGPLRASLGAVQARLHHAESTTERAKEMAERARASLVRAKKIEEEDNPHKDLFKAARDEYVGAKEEAAKLLDGLKERREELGVLEFWVRGFGSQGLPSYILDSVMPYITTRTNHYLEMLSDGDITMEFTTQRELKSAKGEYRDEIDISWFIEGIQDYPPSGGQQRKMEISTDLGLMDLTETREGAGLNLFIADEILDGLDAEGTERVIMLLQELRARRGSIFVISHQSSMSEVFEKSITIVKEGGVSRLEVAA